MPNVWSLLIFFPLSLPYFLSIFLSVFLPHTFVVCRRQFEMISFSLLPHSFPLWFWIVFSLNRWWIVLIECTFTASCCEALFVVWNVLYSIFDYVVTYTSYRDFNVCFSLSDLHGLSLLFFIHWLLLFVLNTIRPLTPPAQLNTKFRFVGNIDFPVLWTHSNALTFLGCFFDSFPGFPFNHSCRFLLLSLWFFFGTF